MTADRDHQLEAIGEGVRRGRPRTPRWLWVVALVVGLGCAVAFTIAMVSGGEVPAGGDPPVPTTTSRGRGFSLGLAIGLATGIAIGVAIARQLRGHSSRKSP